MVSGSFVASLLADMYVVYCVLFVCISGGNYFSIPYSYAFVLWVMLIVLEVWIVLMYFII